MPPPKKPTSVAWVGFDEIEGSKNAQCKHCIQIIKRSTSNTSNMLQHFRTKHEAHYLVAVERAHAESAASASSSTPSPRPSMVKAAAREKGRITSYLDHKSGAPFEPNSAKAKMLNEAVLNMIVLDNQPFTVVDEHAGFIKLIGLCEPRYVLPGRGFIRGLLAPKAAQVRQLVRQKLQDASHVAFTSDIWTEKVTVRSFLSLSAHWIDADWKLQSFVLHATWFKEHHNSVEISDKLLNMLGTWKIGARRRSVMARDGAANMRKGCDQASLPSVHCTIHRLQLVIKDAIFSQPAVKIVITKARRLVAHLNHSSSKTEQFKALQDGPDATRKKLHQDVVTRWNSTYLMLERINELKAYVVQFLIDVHVPDCHFTTAEWRLISKILAILEPFFVITKRLSGDLVTLGCVIPWLAALRLKLKKVPRNLVTTFQDKILDQLEIRFFNTTAEQNLVPDKTSAPDKILNITRCHYYTISTILDPRYKFMVQGEELEKAMAHLTRELLATTTVLDTTTASVSLASPASQPPHAGSQSQACASTSSVGPAISCTPIDINDDDEDDPNVSSGPAQVSQVVDSESDEDELDSLLREHAPDNMVVGGPAVYTDAMKLHELDTYMAEAYIGRSMNPLHYWRDNAKKFPTLVMVAKKYGCIPASSVYSERLFSEFGNVYDRRRSRLTPEAGEDIVFLHHNLPRLEGAVPLLTAVPCEDFELEEALEDEEGVDDDEMRAVPPIAAGDLEAAALALLS